MTEGFWWPTISFDFGRITSTVSHIVLVDDNPYKGCYNPNNNTLFLDAFTNNKLSTANMKVVLHPYFQMMFNNTMSDVCNFVITYKFGQPPIKLNDPMKLSVLMVNMLSNRPNL